MTIYAPIAIADVVVAEGRRRADPDKVKALATSIKEIGLQHPITVRQRGDKYLLVAGLHRLEACRKLDLDFVQAGIAAMSKIDARMWEIAENLHRAELTVQERSDQIKEWIDLSKEKREADRRVSVQVAPKPHGGRPEGGTREAERELGIEHTEAVRAVKIASISPAAKDAAREAGIDDNQSKLLKVAAEAPEHQIEAVHRLSGARAIMASRVEPPDSCDYFPTPPWATRALCEVVLPEIGMHGESAWDPACGEGHMSEVLNEYFGNVQATDIHHYGTHHEIFDFLQTESSNYDWIITNPPFGDLTEQFILRALDLARVGVAMFVRQQWWGEGIGRYERLWKEHEPTLAALFTERVNLCKGRWDPDGTTATAYCWLVWVKGRERMPYFRIPPGQRAALTKPDDRARFASWSMPENVEAAE